MHPIRSGQKRMTWTRDFLIDCARAMRKGTLSVDFDVID
jgi:hypothetical protein